MYLKSDLLKEYVEKQQQMIRLKFHSDNMKPNLLRLTFCPSVIASSVGWRKENLVYSMVNILISHYIVMFLARPAFNHNEAVL